jgi:hypothetical protein
MSQSQRFDSQYEEPFPCPSTTVPAVTNGQRGQPHQSPRTPAEMRSRSVVAQDPCAATLVLIVGLPGAGKTTRAKELATANQALRLTPDEWMIPLFGDPMADGKRFVLEGRLISVALQVLRLETSVVLDYGSRAAMNARLCVGWHDQPGHPARWSTCPWTRTSSSPASRTARRRHRSRRSQ